MFEISNKESIKRFGGTPCRTFIPTFQGVK